MLYILIAVLLFGVLIAVHEFGHFFTAKLFGVRVNEFAIGMGPALVSRQKGETLYALRLFPVGGYCAMEGEDEDSDDPRAFSNQRAWKKIIILCAGAAMNFLTGLLLVLMLYSGAQAFVGTTVVSFAEGFPWQGEEQLMAGDRIVKINGERIYLYNDITMFLNRGHGQLYDLTVERNGQRIELNNLPLEPREYPLENGQTALRFGLNFGYEEATVWNRLTYSWYNAIDFVRLVRISLTDLFSGGVGIKDLAGPIGIVDTITQVGEQAQTVSVAVENILYIGALIAVNLAVMNLLPLPALDGGRVFFLLVGSVWTLVTRRRINPKYEGYIHLVGLVLLLGLTAVVAFNDISRIFGRWF